MKLTQEKKDYIMHIDNMLHLEVMMDENGFDEDFLAGVLVQISWLLENNKDKKGAELLKNLADELK